MPIIIYGGARETVIKQLKCNHDWHGPNMDPISRYMKCLRCFCIERDLLNEAEYFKAASNTDPVGRKDKKRQPTRR